jgi:ketosteroid isomerase-like protein
MIQLATKIEAMTVLLSLTAGCSGGKSHEQIKDVLDRQVAAWNAGDIKGFMDGYWRSEELVFESPKGQTRGWQATLERYEKRYSTREKMGRLRFSGLEIHPTGAVTADVTGRWEVQTTVDRSSGAFILNFRRVDSRWVIVKDHTTSDQEESSPQGH